MLGIMTVYDCCKGYWHQELDDSSSFLKTFNTEFGCYRYTVMHFGATVAGDVFQHKLDQCFGHIPNVIAIADDIMVVGRMQNHRDQDQALTTLLHTARTCNVRLTYNKLQYRANWSRIFWGNLYCGWPQASTKQSENHSWYATTWLQEASSIIHRDGELLVQVFCLLIRACRTN